MLFLSNETHVIGHYSAALRAEWFSEHYNLTLIEGCTLNIMTILQISSRICNLFEIFNIYDTLNNIL